MEEGKLSTLLLPVRGYWAAKLPGTHTLCSVCVRKSFLSLQRASQQPAQSTLCYGNSDSIISIYSLLLALEATLGKRAKWIGHFSFYFVLASQFFLTLNAYKFKWSILSLYYILKWLLEHPVPSYSKQPSSIFLYASSQRNNFHLFFQFENQPYFYRQMLQLGLTCQGAAEDFSHSLLWT